VVLELANGSSVELGPRDVVLSAATEIVDSTGGSSGGGRWSALWGLLTGLGGDVSPLEDWFVEKLAEEANDYERQAGGLVGENALALLATLRGLPARTRSDRR